MISFQSKIDQNKQNHAYMMGVQAAYSNQKMTGPFPEGSDADEQWLEGYLDCVFMRNLTEK